MWQILVRSLLVLWKPVLRFFVNKLLRSWRKIVYEVFTWCLRASQWCLGIWAYLVLATSITIVRLYISLKHRYKGSKNMSFIIYLINLTSLLIFSFGLLFFHISSLSSLYLSMKYIPTTNPDSRFILENVIGYALLLYVVMYYNLYWNNFNYNG